MIVLPVPDIVPPVQTKLPVTVTSPAPVKVPPEWERLTSVTAAPKPHPAGDGEVAQRAIARDGCSTHHHESSRTAN